MCRASRENRRAGLVEPNRDGSFLGFDLDRVHAFHRARDLICKSVPRRHQSGTAHLHRPRAALDLDRGVAEPGMGVASGAYLGGGRHVAHALPLLGAHLCVNQLRVRRQRAALNSSGAP